MKVKRFRPRRGVHYGLYWEPLPRNPWRLFEVDGDGSALRRFEDIDAFRRFQASHHMEPVAGRVGVFRVAAP